MRRVFHQLTDRSSLIDSFEWRVESNYYFRVGVEILKNELNMIITQCQYAKKKQDLYGNIIIIAIAIQKPCADLARG